MPRIGRPRQSIVLYLGEDVTAPSHIEKSPIADVVDRSIELLAAIAVFEFEQGVMIAQDRLRTSIAHCEDWMGRFPEEEKK